MEISRAGQDEREELIKFIEEKLNLKLTPIGRKKAYFHDQTEKLYCLMVANENWQQYHGLNVEYLSDKDCQTGVLFIGICYSDKMEIFQGPIQALVENKNLLPKNSQFHTIEKGDFLLIKEVPGCKLTKIGEAPLDFRPLIGLLKNDSELRKRVEELLKKK